MNENCFADQEQRISWRRQPVAEDREAVRQLLLPHGLFSTSEIAIAVELVDDWLERGAASGYQFLFLEEDPHVLGYGCFGPIPCTHDSYDLYWIAVATHYQRRGLGRIILQEVETLVQQAGGRQLYIDTSGRAQYDPTRAFYERCGYERVALLPDFYSVGDPKVIFAKRLA